MADSHSDVVAITQLVNLYGLAATRSRCRAHRRPRRCARHAGHIKSPACVHTELADCQRLTIESLTTAPFIYESLTRGGLAVAGAAAHARKTSDTTRHAARTPELAAGTAADARDAALPTGTAARAGELAAGAAVAVGVATASAWVLLEDHMRRCRASHRRASRESFS
jgi:hypothetical protein